MRGKLLVDDARLLRAGITPAHAGKTIPHIRGARHEGDHPRACGENNIFPLQRTRIPGSPPRMRGKHLIGSHKVYLFGITPAHAGKTLRRTEACSGAWDHPRACGENRPVIRLKPPQTGSPPRMRGKLVAGVDFGCATGITPAHAGKTRNRPLRGQGFRDHPRACGENHPGQPERGKQAGSPPRMRGKLFFAPFNQLAPRITPAHAGKTNGVNILPVGDKDHPRACGENFAI